jgi:hypothetical protein
MKKLFILSLVALSTLTVNAQRKKTKANTSQGNWALRLGAGYNSNTVDPTNVPVTKTTSTNFTPSVGYFVSDNLEIGIKFDVNSTKVNSTFNDSTIENKNNSVGFGIYGLKYFPVNNWFAFTGGLELGLMNGTGNLQTFKYTKYYTVGYTTNSFGGAANFGMAFTPVNRLAIQANIIGLGAVSGTRNNENGVADVNTSDFGLNVWRAPASVSLVWYFGRGLE